jgi:hypothetical protein
MKVILAITSVILGGGWAVLWAAPAYPEPTEQEMRSVMERTMLQRGGTQTGPGEISIDNAINGMKMTIVSFTKLGCEPANQGPGYVCSYQVKSKMTVHSNERSREGDRHADAVNSLLRGMMGGRETVVDVATRRFLRMADEWVMSRE